MTTTKNFFRASAEDFKKIPGSPVAYWVGRIVNVFNSETSINAYSEPRAGFSTGDNDRYLRMWFEISKHKIAFGLHSNSEFLGSGLSYVPCKKGGNFRRWFGDAEFVVKWIDSNRFHRARTTYLDSYYKRAVSWNAISSGKFHSRFCYEGFLFDHAAAFLVPTREDYAYPLQGYMSSVVFEYLFKILNPTINNGADVVSNVPMVRSILSNLRITEIVKRCVSISQFDWDAYETSWDFAVNPLVALCDSLRPLRSLCQHPQGGEAGSGGALGDRALPELYTELREKWAADCLEMRRLETENNRIFIEAYGLQDELTPEVPWNEITLTCNPFYRYGVRNEELGIRNDGGQIFPLNAELEERLKSDTVKELISYGVGCMMGRYSLAKPGLVLADQGATLADYWEKLGMRNEELGIGGKDLSAIPHSSFLIPHS